MTRHREVAAFGSDRGRRTLRSTNAIESIISISRDHARNVKPWSDGQMALRWWAACMVEARKQFCRVNGQAISGTS